MQTYPAEQARAPDLIDPSPLPGAVRYRRHRPEETVLYRLVEQHFPAFQRRLAERERQLPGFVLDEFRSYLACGRMEHGFIRVKCDGCRHELLVAFSCKKRGICPSCGARRMVETAAHLADHVMPRIPVRQWVLSFPWPLRMLFAARPDALTRCLDVVVRSIEAHLLQRAGLRRASGARTGVVTLIQRHGSAANLNVHLHMLVLDGVYEPVGEQVRFRPVSAPSEAQLQSVLTRLIARILRRLTKDGWLSQDTEPPSLDLEPTDVVDELAVASIRYRIADGPGAGQRTLTLRSPALARPATPKPLTADLQGFSLNAAVACTAVQRNKLERLARYVARPAIALERLTVDSAGRVVLELTHPFRDGTTHMLFSPEDWLARLAALVPRPRAHLTRYHGVFAPNCRLRARVVPSPRGTAARKRQQTKARKASSPPILPALNDDGLPLAPMTWAQRLRRVFEIDITTCPDCGGRLRWIDDVTEPALIHKILLHVQARAPPRSGLPDGTFTDADAHFTLAG